MNFYGGVANNIRDDMGRCLQLMNPSNRHGEVLRFHSCNSKSHTGWTLATRDTTAQYKPPIRDGIGFFIRSKMRYRRMFCPIRAAHNRERLVTIQNFDPRRRRDCMWTFDSRTKTIRLHANRGYVLDSNRSARFMILSHYSNRPE
jgi:hypothetical protein